MTEHANGGHPGSIPLMFGGAVAPNGNPLLQIAHGGIVFTLDMLNLQAAEQIKTMLCQAVDSAITQAGRRASGLALPGMPGFPMGNFPGAQPIPPVDPGTLQRPPPGHPG